MSDLLVCFLTSTKIEFGRRIRKFDQTYISNTEYRPGEQDYPLFDYSGLEAAPPSPSQQQTWKYTEQPSTAATPTTKDWHQFVNNKGITNWEDHLRSQGIDPQVKFPRE